MSTMLTILNELVLVVIKVLTPRDRWRAVSAPFRSRRQPVSWVVPVSIIVALIVMMCALWAAQTIIAARKRRRLRVIESESDRFGLSEEERNLLYNIAAGAGVQRMDQIFRSPAAFDRGVTAVEDRNIVPAASGRPPVRMCASCAYILSLREKLGFDESSDRARPTSVELGKIPQGTVLNVLRQRRPESFDAVSHGRTGKQELLVAPSITIESHPGESWMMRYLEAGVLWEFTALVTRNLNGTVALKPTGELRWINRRRFLRTPTRKPAHIALFPFRCDESPSATPQFVPGQLVEIAGPGVRLRTTLKADQDDKVLVVTKLRPGNTIQGVGVIKHVKRYDHELSTLAVELIGLTSSEVADLARETNVLAVKGKAAGEEGAEVIAGRNRRK